MKSLYLLRSRTKLRWQYLFVVCLCCLCWWQTNEIFRMAVRTTLYGQSLWHFSCFYNFVSFVLSHKQSEKKQTFPWLRRAVDSGFWNKKWCHSKSFSRWESWLCVCVSRSIPRYRGSIDMRVQHENYSLIIVCLILLFFDENYSFSLSREICCLEIKPCEQFPQGLREDRPVFLVMKYRDCWLRLCSPVPFLHK